MKRKNKLHFLNKLIIPTTIMPIFLAAKCNTKEPNDNIEIKEDKLKALYEETAHNAKYTIHFMQHGGYPISHQICSMIYLDKESKSQNKQIMFWANDGIDNESAWKDIKGYNQIEFGKHYNFVPFVDENSFRNNYFSMYYVKSNSDTKYNQYQKIADFIKKHPGEVDFSLTFLEWRRYLLVPAHKKQLFDILMNARKIIIISDGTAQSYEFNLAFNEYKSELEKLSIKEINKKFEFYKNKKYDECKEQFDKECPLMWIYLDKKVNNSPFISLVNYDTSYLESDYYKLPKLGIPYNTNQNVFHGKYAQWNKEAKPIIESTVKITSDLNIFSKKSNDFDFKKKTAVFMGDGLFREFPGEVDAQGKKHTRLLKMPNVLKEQQKIFKEFLKKYDPKEYNIVFKLHPRFNEEYNLEYVKLISNGAIDENNLNIINSKLSWEIIMTNELIKFQNNPEKDNLLFKDKNNLFGGFEIFGFVPTSTVLLTTMMFVYIESGYNNSKVLEVVKPENFPIAKTFYISRYTNDDANEGTDYRKTNREDVANYMYKYQNIKNWKFVELMKEVKDN